MMEMGSTSPAAAVASVRRPADRRALYRRSNTISALPLDSLPVVARVSPTAGTDRRFTGAGRSGGSDGRAVEAAGDGRPSGSPSAG